MKNVKNTIKMLLAMNMLIFIACNSGFYGKYKGEVPMGLSTIAIEFKSNGKAQITGGAMGRTSITEVDFKKEGDQVKLIIGDQNQIFTIDNEGCLNGMGAKLCKVKE